jgi:hypothetical protein
MKGLVGQGNLVGRGSRLRPNLSANTNHGKGFVGQGRRAAIPRRPSYFPI